MDQLLREVEKVFSVRMTRLEVMLPHSRMDLVDLFYRQGKVEEIEYQQKGIRVKLTLPTVLSQKLLHHKEIHKI